MNKWIIFSALTLSVLSNPNANSAASGKKSIAKTGAPSATQKNVNDMKCMLTFGQIHDDPEAVEKESLTIMMAFFIGKLHGRNGDSFSLIKFGEANAVVLTNLDDEEAMRRCKKEFDRTMK